jgi:hypothetical protein
VTTLKRCRKCDAQFARRLSICPHCGHLETVDRELENQIKNLEIEINVLRNRVSQSGRTAKQIPQIVSVAVVGLVVGTAFALVTDFIPELVNDSAPLMLLIASLFYVHVVWERRNRREPEVHPTQVNTSTSDYFYLASSALIFAAVVAGWLFVDKSRLSIQFTLVSHIYVLVTIGSYVVWRTVERD